MCGRGSDAIRVIARHLRSQLFVAEDVAVWVRGAGGAAVTRGRGAALPGYKLAARGQHYPDGLGTTYTTTTGCTWRVKLKFFHRALFPKRLPTDRVGNPP